MMYAVSIKGCDDSAFIIGEPVRINSYLELEEYKDSITRIDNALVIYGTREHLLLSSLGLEDSDFGTKEELLIDISSDVSLMTEDK